MEETPTPTVEETPTPTAEESQTSDDTGKEPALEEAIDLEESYAFEITAHYQDLQVTGRQHQNDYYHEVDLRGTHVEEYYVDGTAHVVTEGVCVTNPSASADPTSSLDLTMTKPATFEETIAGHATVRTTGTTTIDGETAYRYEVTTDGVATTYVVSAETGYLRRVEVDAPKGDVMVEFHSWGDVDPVEPPSSCVSDSQTPDEASEGPPLEEAIDLEESYAFEITAHYQDLQVTGRQYQDDYYHDVQLSGTHVEEYVVNGTAYVVTEGVCVTNPSASADPTSALDLSMTKPETFEGTIAGHATVRTTGTTTIDGETAYRYEVTTNGAQSVYFVDTDTGLLRRAEIAAPEGDVIVKFHSWGNVDPIEPPSSCVIDG